MSDFASEIAMNDFTEGCDCEFAKRHPNHRSLEVGRYLRELADRVDGGEIRHVSVSAHPVEHST